MAQSMGRVAPLPASPGEALPEMAEPPRDAARVATPSSSFAEGWMRLKPATISLPEKRVRVATLKNIPPMSEPPALMPA